MIRWVCIQVCRWRTAGRHHRSHSRSHRSTLWGRSYPGSSTAATETKKEELNYTPHLPLWCWSCLNGSLNWVSFSCSVFRTGNMDAGEVFLLMTGFLHLLFFLSYNFDHNFNQSIMSVSLWCKLNSYHRENTQVIFRNIRVFWCLDHHMVLVEGWDWSLTLVGPLPWITTGSVS